MAFIYWLLFSNPHLEVRVELTLDDVERVGGGTLGVVGLWFIYDQDDGDVLAADHRHHTDEPGVLVGSVGGLPGFVGLRCQRFHVADDHVSDPTLIRESHRLGDVLDAAAW